MFKPHLLTVDEQDVMSVEKTYWSLRGADKCSLNTFEQYTSPLLPKELCASELERFGSLRVYSQGYLCSNYACLTVT